MIGINLQGRPECDKCKKPAICRWGTLWLCGECVIERDKYEKEKLIQKDQAWLQESKNAN